MSDLSPLPVTLTLEEKAELIIRFYAEMSKTVPEVQGYREKIFLMGAYAIRHTSPPNVLVAAIAGNIVGTLIGLHIPIEATEYMPLFQIVTPTVMATATDEELDMAEMAFSARPID